MCIQIDQKVAKWMQLTQLLAQFLSNHKSEKKTPHMTFYKDKIFLLYWQEELYEQIKCWAVSKSDESLIGAYNFAVN